MTQKLLNNSEAAGSCADELCVEVDHVVLVLPLGSRLLESLSSIERAASLELAVAYDAQSTRDASSAALESQTFQELRRLGFVRGKPGIGWPASVHLERFAAPSRIALSNTPAISALGGAGMLALRASDDQLLDVIATGHTRWRTPRILQIILSGRLGACVAARDVGFELLRRGIADKVTTLREAYGAPIVLEFSGPGVHSLTVHERALLTSMSEHLGADSAVAVSDDRTESFLRDQRRSKAFRQLTSDPGADCADAICLDLATVVPLVGLDPTAIHPASELGQWSVREVVIGADHSVGLRELLSAAAWFKTKRICTDVDVIVVPPTRQMTETLSATGALSQLLSAGARLLEPDPRLISGELHRPPYEGTSLRTFAGPLNSPGSWGVASIDTLCTTAMTGVIQDPRTRKPPRLSMPRELPVDDSLLFDRRPSTSATLPPPACATATQIGSTFPLAPERPPERAGLTHGLAID
jgi:aconitate hydratase